MKTKLIYVLAVLGCLLSCRKDQQAGPSGPKPPGKTDSLTLDQVKHFFNAQTNSPGLLTQNKGQPFNLSDLRVPWTDARSFTNKTGNYWIVPLNGTPSFRNYKQGYRKIAFIKDTAGHLQARILEIIPDGLYFQRKRKVSTNDFTGRIFVYDQLYHLISGEIRSNGKLIGTIKPGTAGNTAPSGMRTDNMIVTQQCQWYDSNYINSDGVVTVHSERICDDLVIDDGAGGGVSGSGDYLGHGSSSGGASGAPASDPPPVSNLPGESGPAVDPKKLMECFGNVASAGAKMTVTVYVQEPFPGTSFNIGPNSVGHVAIGLTKTNGSSSVTQVLGFYPDATGLDKMHAPSKILVNNSLDYNVSISYTVSSDNFNKIMNYVANPPATYDLTDFNCTSFVYFACKTGNVTLPNPYTTVGIPMPTGPTSAMTPAGLGQSISLQKGKSNVNTNGGTTPNSKGPCNN